MGGSDQTTAISRRGFLKIVGTGTALVVLDARSAFEGGPLAALTDDDGVLVTELFRPDDQLHLVFEFVNLSHDIPTNSLVATGAGTPLMRVRLPRQHVAEQPLVAGTTPSGRASAPIEHRVAARSRLVFEVAPPLSLDLASLLDFGAHTLVTTTAAGNPDVDTTMIEVPADLRWSPATSVEVDADVAPRTFGSVSQLHRFVLRGPGGVEFTPVFNATSDDGFARRIPNTGQRDAIVAAATTEGAAVSDRLWLTPFGAWADIAREWTNIDWIQRIQGGRDQFVQVVERGVLLPFGHQAVVTSTVTRQWLVDADGAVVAETIAEEHFALAGDPVVEFPGVGAPNDGRDLPFQSIRIEDRESISAGRRQLAWTAPDNSSRTIPTTSAWEVEQGPQAKYPGADIRIAYTGTDRAGAESAGFRLPAVFVPAANLTPALLGDLADFFASDEGERARRTTVSRDMAWAEPFPEESRSSILYTSQIDFSFRPGVGGAPVAPHVTLGVVSKPDLIPPEAARPAIEVVFSPEYLASGNDPADNPSAAFLDLVESVDLPVGAEARAVLTPEFTAEEFNQTLGVGPKLESVGPSAPAVWSPEEAFGAAAELLRGIKLADLVAPILLDAALPGVDIPEFSITELPESITQTYKWCPTEINSVSAAGFIATTDTSLCVTLTTVIALDLDLDASGSIVFEVRNFTLQVPPSPVTLIEFDINSLRAVAPSDGPVDLTFDVEEWRLGGLLAWIEPLIASLVPAGSAFDIDVTSTSINTDLAVALPNLNLGVLEIRNFALELSGEFPFVDGQDPRIEFKVGTRREPVSLQIMQFGGGFSVAIAFSATGIVKIAVRAEVSARLFVVDVGIAEAYLEVGVSVAFIWSEGDLTFIGELWVEMALDLLGLVSATVRITARIKYDFTTEIVTFSGTIHWSVTALFTYSGSVPLGSTDFALGDGAGASGFAAGVTAPSALLSQSPTPSRAGSFGDAHDLASWNDYVSKFAVEV